MAGAARAASSGGAFDVSRFCLLALLLALAGCAGSGRDAAGVAKTDPRYCESRGLGIGSDAYADCRLRQLNPEPGS